jgi:uncharacterized protein YsxB (DUF464 family)
MITVNIERDKNENIVAFFVEGHAEYAPYGEDIVCAAVSAIVQTAVFGLINYLNLYPNIDTKDGCLDCRLDSSIAKDIKVKAILETMLIGLQETATAYAQYLKIIEGGGSND